MNFFSRGRETHNGHNNNVFDLNFLFEKNLKNFDDPVYRMRNEEN